MYLINKYSGVAEEVSDAGMQGEESEKVITRTSDRKKNPGRKVSKSSTTAPGEFTRSSDRKPRYPKKTANEPREAPAHSSKSYAVWLLARRDYSAVNLRKKLVMRGYSEEQADEALQFVIANNFQNDKRFAEQRSRGAENRAGNVRIEMTLRQKGIAPDLAREQVGQLGPEEERVVLAASKFAAHVSRESMTPELKAKIYRFLAYRGFSSKAIRVAIDSLNRAATAQREE
ncbi:MAG: RecX family transcriptional regulator [Herminiimonas sp.]|nr:RecX family transcriptional regulator [Herminiimonas sp.]